MPTEEPDMMSSPDQKEDTLKNGLLCFISPTRECGADCMAFSNAPPGKDYEEQQWACCKLLVAAHQVAKHTTVLANISAQEQAERKRTQQTPPPVVK